MTSSSFSLPFPRKKPYIPPIQKYPLGGKRMTIAIGQLCVRGIIIGADTLVTMSDGSTMEEVKTTPITGKSGIFALANASADLNATRTMVNKFIQILDKSSISNIGQLQSRLTEIMTTWSASFGHQPPSSQIILASKLKDDGPRLFLCEPPSTFLQVTDGYISAGAGSSITDQLHKMLLGFTDESTPVQASLRRLSYLIHRAKTGNAFCGKRTSAIVIGASEPEPIIVNTLDLQAQENISSELDFLLHTTTIFALSSTPDNLKSNAAGLGRMLEDLAGIRSVVFHNVYNQEINL